MRILGAIFLLIAVGLLLAEVVGWSTGDRASSFRLTSLGEWWFWAHPDSLQVLGPAVERHVPGGVWIYETIIQPLLLWPAAVEAFVVGLVLSVLGRTSL